MQNSSNDKRMSILYTTFKSYMSDFFISLDKEELIHMETFVPAIFNKWFYSSLIKDTALSPSNILNSASYDCYEQTMLKSYYDTDSNSFLFSNYTNSLDEHVFITDLNNLCEYFKSGNTFPQEIPQTIKEELNIYDPYYYDYLFQVAKKLDLVSPMLSIGEVIYVKNEKLCKKFFSKGVVANLKEIVKVCFELFENNFFTKLDVPVSTLSKEDILAFFKTSHCTDNIFTLFYKNLGFDFKQMTSLLDEDNLDDDSKYLLSSVYFMGAYLDRWLFTPLSSYLDLLSPLYIMPFSFEDILTSIRPTLLVKSDKTNDLFSPCNFYNLTLLGSKVFSIKNIDSELSLNGIYLDYDQLFAILANVKKEDGLDMESHKNILKLKISLDNNENLWKIIEVPESFTLDYFYKNSTYFLGYEPFDSYTLTLIEKNDNSAVEILSTAFQLKIKDLKLKNNDLYLTDNKHKLKISLIDKKTGVFKGEYPKLIKQSQEITLLEHKEME